MSVETEDIQRYITEGKRELILSILFIVSTFVFFGPLIVLYNDRFSQYILTIFSILIILSIMLLSFMVFKFKTDKEAVSELEDEESMDKMNSSIITLATVSTILGVILFFYSLILFYSIKERRNN